jgi:hypothetical protein
MGSAPNIGINEPCKDKSKRLDNQLTSLVIINSVLLLDGADETRAEYDDPAPVV